MGQYWLPVNLDKNEFIDPHKLASGLKLWEILAADGVGRALVVLLAAMPEVRGGGDLQGGYDIVGHWAGDRIAFVGDYAEDTDLAPEHCASTIYERCRQYEPDEGEVAPEGPLFTDVTDQVIEVIERELEGKYVGDGWREWKANS